MPDEPYPFHKGWFSISGRRGRLSYLLGYIAVTLVTMAFLWLLFAFSPFAQEFQSEGFDEASHDFASGSAISFFVGVFVWLLLTSYISLMLAAQRLRHIGLPGFLVVFMIPLALLLVAEEQLGLSPFVSIAMVLVTLFLLLMPGRTLDLEGED